MARLLSRKNIRGDDNPGFQGAPKFFEVSSAGSIHINFNQREAILKAINCCKAMESEMTAWEATIYDIVCKADYSNSSFPCEIADSNHSIYPKDKISIKIRGRSQRLKIPPITALR